MITNFEITNFKSLADISLSLTNLNVITGINGMGKSSLIQALLLLRQSYVPFGIRRGIPLKGHLTGNLGDFNDVLFRNSQNDKIAFKIQNAEKKYVWEFEKGDIKDMLQGNLPKDIDGTIPLFADNKFQYISAGRITPTSVFSKSGEALAFKQFGISGEYAIQYLFEKGTDDALFSEIFFENNNSGPPKPLPLINQVDYWLKYITPNVSLDIFPKSSTEYELRYKFLNGDKGASSFSAINSAFGLTFSLPIITALLAAQKGDLIILENPESDLHPKAQSIIGQLLGKAAAAGIQIIVETHSDHILNGICVAIHKGQIKNDLVKFYYFHKRDNQLQTNKYEVPINENGRIDDRNLREIGVEGFLDQANKDLGTILFTPSNG
jgi:predicted ATPase